MDFAGVEIRHIIWNVFLLKTKYIYNNIKVKFWEHIIPQVTQFNYLWSIVQNNGEKDISKPPHSNWVVKCTGVSDVLGYTKVPLTLKRKFYQTIVRLTMLYEKIIPL